MKSVLPSVVVGGVEMVGGRVGYPDALPVTGIVVIQVDPGRWSGEHLGRRAS